MADAFTKEAFSLLGVGVAFVLLREVARVSTVGFKGLWADDYLMLLATVVYALETTAAYAVGAWYRGLANNGLDDDHRRNLSIHSQEYIWRVNGSKTQLIGWSLYTLLLWLLKLCMCIFYARLTQGLDYMKWRVRIGYVLVISTYIAVEAAILFGCRPFNHNWQIRPNPGNHCQPAVSKVDLYVTVILNVISDAYLLTIPLPLFLKADLPWTKKLSLIGLFSGGVFVMAAGCLRCALIIQDPIGGAQAAGSWAVRETFVAVIVANLPIVYQGYRKLVHPTVVSSINALSNERSGYSQSKEEPDHELSSAATSSSRKPWLVHPTTTEICHGESSRDTKDRTTTTISANTANRAA